MDIEPFGLEDYPALVDNCVDDVDEEEGSAGVDLVAGNTNIHIVVFSFTVPRSDPNSPAPQPVSDKAASAPQGVVDPRHEFPVPRQFGSAWRMRPRCAPRRRSSTRPSPRRRTPRTLGVVFSTAGRLQQPESFDHQRHGQVHVASLPLNCASVRCPKRPHWQTQRGLGSTYRHPGWPAGCFCSERGPAVARRKAAKSCEKPIQ